MSRVKKTKHPNDTLVVTLTFLYNSTTIFIDLILKGGEYMKLQDMWWILLLEGLFLLLFGFVAIGWPGLTVVTLVFAFAIYILLSGVLNIVHSIVGTKNHGYWFLTLIMGIIEVAVGVYALNNPGLTIAVLVLLIGFTFIVRGVLGIVSAFSPMYKDTHKLLLIVVGVLSVLAGIIILRYPLVGTLAFTWVIGVYALIAGAIMVALSISVKEVTHSKRSR